MVLQGEWGTEGCCEVLSQRGEAIEGDGAECRTWSKPCSPIQIAAVRKGFSGLKMKKAFPVGGTCLIILSVRGCTASLAVKTGLGLASRQKGHISWHFGHATLP